VTGRIVGRQHRCPQFEKNGPGAHILEELGA